MSVEEHAEHLDAVLTSLFDHNLFCQLPTCVFAQSELKYLGHIVSGKGVLPDPTKVSSLDKWLPPLELVQSMEGATPQMAASKRKQLVHECRKYLGFMNYFNRFIPRYSEVAGVLHDQTKDLAPQWTSSCTAAWLALAQLLKTATLMYHPVHTKPSHVYSDAVMWSLRVAPQAG